MTKILSTSLLFALLLTACATNQQKEETHKPAEPSVASQETQKPEADADHKSHKNSAHDGATQCSKGKDVRTLHVGKKQPAGCELHYTKFNQTETVASSSVGTQHCESVKEKIEKNLKAAGFECH